ncbi:uncharacterized protein LOC111404505 [Olea europaea var. sylvestris]|uniref:uncharacterized protein LOC111404505 n=1 Tax=Olea europaea var. sylvestris TaxID=158386 RepID=UPI000C1D3513|nr:uncharacterized protein LOC111404505 [Olea europaea var. sylvestris]
MSSSDNSLFNPADDPTSHYYLHPSDNPGALIVSEIFNGDNYNSWSRSISMALSVKNKLGFIDGSLKSPSPSSIVTYNCLVRANDLVIRYIQSDGPRVYYLEKCLSSISQGSQSLTVYYNSFKAIWEEYISYRPLPKFSCGMLSNYTRDTLKNISNTQQSDAVMKFLVGLNECYSALRSQLLLTSPRPLLAQVYALMLQKESQRDLQNHSSPESAAMTARQPHRTFNKPHSWKDKKKPECTHCGYPNHTADKCFQIIGYPPGWKGPRGPRTLIDTSAAHVVSLDQSAEHEEPSISFNQDLFQQLLAFAKTQQISLQ